MGFFAEKETTHGSRSSSMTYALRWKQEKKRQLKFAGMITVAVLVSVMTLLYIQSDKGNHLSAQGKSEPLSPPAQGRLPAAQANGTVPLMSTFSDGSELFIHPAVPVRVTADGMTNLHFTNQETVKEAISKLGLTVSAEDKIYPAMDSAISSNMHIRIVRIDKRVAKTTERIPFTFVKTSYPSLEQGKTKLIQEGSTGLKVHEVEKVYQDGKLISKRLVNTSVAKNPTSKVLAVGTKPKPKNLVLGASIDRSSNTVKKGGMQFKYKKMLKNMSLTAYSKEEPGLGTKTASGAHVTEGRTIAVDTKLIPMGWWVYIEGVGFRKAEDTGGAIKGNIIDVYYDSLDAANDFGRKKGRTVYVIGPNKPELN